MMIARMPSYGGFKVTGSTKLFSASEIPVGSSRILSFFALLLLQRLPGYVLRRSPPCPLGALCLISAVDVWSDGASASLGHRQHLQPAIWSEKTSLALTTIAFLIPSLFLLSLPPHFNGKSVHGPAAVVDYAVSRAHSYWVVVPRWLLYVDSFRVLMNL
jgi:hypothetical protein